MLCMADEPTELSEFEALAEQAQELSRMMEPHRQAMAELGMRRREVIARMVELSSVSQVARRLGVSRQAIHQLIQKQ